MAHHFRISGVALLLVPLVLAGCGSGSKPQSAAARTSATTCGDQYNRARAEWEARRKESAVAQEASVAQWKGRKAAWDADPAHGGGGAPSRWASVKAQDDALTDATREISDRHQTAVNVLAGYSETRGPDGAPTLLGPGPTPGSAEHAKWEAIRKEAAAQLDARFYLPRQRLIAANPDLFQFAGNGPGTGLLISQPADEQKANAFPEPEPPNQFKEPEPVNSCPAPGPEEADPAKSPRPSGGSSDGPERIAATLGCEGYEHTPEDEQEMGVDDAGECRWDDEDVEIYTFKDKEQLKNYEGFARTFGCEMGKAFGVSSVSYVRGSTWVVQPDSKTTTEKVAAKIGGKATTLECG